MTDRSIQAYDLHVLKDAFDEDQPELHGWILGSPPGIPARHWPIDPCSGYPLMHGFTLRLPEDHRVHGPEIVGLSFFAPAPDHCDGSPLIGVESAALLAAHPDAPPEDPHLAAIWNHIKDEHPRLHRMQDILSAEYAVILLTEAELAEPPCEVPEWASGPALADVRKPAWLADLQGSGEGRRRAVRWAPRAVDPNAGVKAEEFPGPDSPYTSPYDPRTYELVDWAKDHSPNHIGGTMRPIQGYPDFSPHFIGFEEDFGDYNFGTGNAQLDFLQMKLDWACG